MKLHFNKSGHGKPLLILHGLFGMSDNWSTIAKELTGTGILTYRIDARNHGRSPHSEDFNYQIMSNDILELMEDEKIPTASIIGHSMGAKTAMWFACRYPDRVSSLLVSDMAPRYYTPHHQSVIAAIHSVHINEIESRKEAEIKLRENLRDEATVQFLLKNIYWNENEKLDWRFYLQGIEKNIENSGEALPASYRFNGKTLFLRGERSGYITDMDIPIIHKHFPAAKIETIPRAGHWIHSENPAGFIQAVKIFLKEN